MKAPQDCSEAIKYFHSLDALREIAALSVVLWHWKFFFVLENTNNIFQIENKPFYGIRLAPSSKSSHLSRKMKSYRT